MSLLQQLSDGDCAIRNDGTVDDLNRILKIAFPNCVPISGGEKYYFKAPNFNAWDCHSFTNLPAYSVKDFIAELDDAQNSTNDFTLPEKWCIKQNISEVVCNWFEKNNKYGHKPQLKGTFKFLCYPEENSFYHIFSNEIPDGYTEITFDQFKKYVLNEKSLQYAVMLSDSGAPTKLHDTYEAAESECLRLVEKNKRKGYVLKVCAEIKLEPKINKLCN